MELDAASLEKQESFVQIDSIYLNADGQLDIDVGRMRDAAISLVLRGQCTTQLLLSRSACAERLPQRIAAA